MEDPGLLLLVLGAVLSLAALSGLALWRNHTSGQGR